MAAFGAVVWVLCLSGGTVLAFPPDLGVEFTARDAVIQTVRCRRTSLNRQPSFINLRSQDKNHTVGQLSIRNVTQSPQVALNGSLPDRFLNLAWEQSDSLDLRFDYDKYYCHYENIPEKSSPLQNIAAERWEWFLARQQPEKQASIVVRFRNGDKAIQIPPSGDPQDGVMKFFQYEPDIIMYRALQTKAGTQLVLLFAKSAVREAECKVILETKLHACRTPPSSNMTTASNRTSDAEGICVPMEVVVAVVVVAIFFVIVVIVVGLCWCGRRRNNASDPGRGAAMNDLTHLPLNEGEGGAERDGGD